MHTWLINAGQNDDGGITSAVDAGNLFSVQVNFSGGNTTAFPEESAPGVDELLSLPAVEELVKRYGITSPLR